MLVFFYPPCARETSRVIAGVTTSPSLSQHQLRPIITTTITITITITTTPMTAWIDTLPRELASAIAESNLFELLSPYRTNFTATFGEAPILTSDEASLDDIDHLDHNPTRSAFFSNLLSRPGWLTPPLLRLIEANLDPLL